LILNPPVTKSITSLKIRYNPFAKAFLDAKERLEQQRVQGSESPHPLRVACSCYMHSTDYHGKHSSHISAYSHKFPYVMHHHQRPSFIVKDDGTEVQSPLPYHLPQHIKSRGRLVPNVSASYVYNPPTQANVSTSYVYNPPTQANVSTSYLYNPPTQANVCRIENCKCKFRLHVE